MVVKKSEYQNQYKACGIKKHQAAYLENLNLRLRRRDREFLHTPICWEELNEGDEKVSSDSCEEEQPKEVKTQAEPETQYQSLAEILSDSKEKEIARKQRQLESLIKSRDCSNESTQKKLPNDTDVHCRAPVEDEKVIIKQTDCLNQKSEKKDLADKSDSLHDFLDENLKLNKKHAQGGNNRRNVSVGTDNVKTADRLLNEDRKSSASKTTKICRKKRRVPEELYEIKQSTQANNSSVRSQNAASSGRHCYGLQPTEISSSEVGVPPLIYVPRIRRPDRQVHIPRVKSTPVSPERPLKERPPFVAYGIGDKEDNLASHRTHNVRASVDVYPPALRAKTRRNEEHNRRQKEKLYRAHSAETLRDKLSAACTHSTVDWESEYRKQFHGYEPKDYEKAIASHAVIPRSSQVRAVHRGGCLLVHVD